MIKLLVTEKQKTLLKESPFVDLVTSYLFAKFFIGTIVVSFTVFKKLIDKITGKSKSHLEYLFIQNLQSEVINFIFTGNFNNNKTEGVKELSETEAKKNLNYNLAIVDYSKNFREENLNNYADFITDFNNAYKQKIEDYKKGKDSVLYDLYKNCTPFDSCIDKYVKILIKEGLKNKDNPDFDDEKHLIKLQKSLSDYFLKDGCVKKRLDKFVEIREFLNTVRREYQSTPYLSIIDELEALLSFSESFVFETFPEFVKDNYYIGRFKM